MKLLKSLRKMAIRFFIDVKKIGDPYKVATGVHMYSYTGQMYGVFVFGRLLFKFETESDRRFL
jgi:hypothetical protein